MTALKCLIINLFNYLSLYLCINLSDNYGGLLDDSYNILQRSHIEYNNVWKFKYIQLSHWWLILILI